MNQAVRTARLRGAKEAHRILLLAEARDRLKANNDHIDVFSILAELDVVVLFRPLQGLLGAFIRGGDAPGVLISTKRPLSVQRFTAAHELGHAVMNHRPSLDSEEVLRRAEAGEVTRTPSGFASWLQEVEAESFAGELLMPRWLILHHAKRQNWGLLDLSSPAVIYQLSLRCGTSYQATVNALQRNRLISATAAQKAGRVAPQKIKAAIRTNPEWANGWANTWRLSSFDSGVPIAVEVGDLIAVTLQHRAGAGYLWEFAEPLSEELSELHTHVEIPQETVGGETAKTITLRAEKASTQRLRLVEMRPWNGDSVAEAEFLIVAQSKEEGLARACRERLIAAV